MYGMYKIIIIIVSPNNIKIPRVNNILSFVLYSFSQSSSVIELPFSFTQLLKYSVFNASKSIFSVY